MDVSAPATWIAFSVCLVRALSGALAPNRAAIGSSVSELHESPTPTGPSGSGTVIPLTLFPICSTTGDCWPSIPLKLALTTCMRSSYTTLLVSPRIRSSAGAMPAGTMVVES